LRATELLPILDRFLEAVARTRREKALATETAKAERAIGQAFEEQGRVFLESWERAVRRAGLREGPPPPPPPPPTDPALALPWESAFSEAEIATLQLFEGPIQALVEEALRVGARAAIAGLEADISFSLANPRAVAFLEQYGARRVTMINETTRSEIQRMVARGVREGLSYDQVAKEITGRFREFAVGKPQLHIDSRAHLVAVQEAGEAYEEGNLIVGQQLRDAGIEMEKKWSTTGDSRVSDLCRRNAAAGWIPLEQSFPSGHDRPLGHVACRCAALYQRKPTKKTTL
jgi:hypothetical protein